MQTSTQLLAGRKALVTGGTAGIGRGIAQRLIAHGAEVVVTGHTEEEVRAAREVGLSALLLDVRSAPTCHQVVDEATALLGGLDILAANAGIYPQARISEATAEDFDTIFDVNVRGMLHIIQAASGALKESGRGRIIVTSSITGNNTGFPEWSLYGATKAAQMGFVRSAAIELAPARITVNAVLPGNILTPGLKEMGQDYIDAMTRSVPLGFLGEPEDIGEAVAFLASDGARYITGQGLIIDGGQVLPETPEAVAGIQ